MKNLKNIETYYLIGTDCRDSLTGTNSFTYSVKVKSGNGRYSTLFFAEGVQIQMNDPMTFCWTEDLERFIDNPCHATFGCYENLEHSYPHSGTMRIKIFAESGSLETFLHECNKLIVGKELSK